MEEQAVERAGLHNLVEEKAGLEEGNWRMLPVLFIFSFLVGKDELWGWDLDLYDCVGLGLDNICSAGYLGILKALLRGGLTELDCDWMEVEAKNLCWWFGYFFYPAIKKGFWAVLIKYAVFVLRFYGPVNPMGSCQERSVYLTTYLLGRLSPLSV